MYEGFYRDIELGDPTKTTTEIQKAKDEETGFSANNDDRYVILECHVNLDLPGYEDLDKHGEPTALPCRTWSRSINRLVTSSVSTATGVRMTS
jgi:hypothetical protein